jgi:hypothetical protein
MKLFCAIVGAAGSAFPVDIDTSQSVGDLKEAIKEKNSMTIPRDSKDMKLFLAKKDKGLGAWLTDDDSLDAVLQSGDVSSYVEMRVSWKLSKPSLFGSSVSLGEDKIHVLAVVPDQRTSVPTVSQDGVFDHCRNSFFLQFPRVDQVGDWLDFSSLLPLTRCLALYIRSSYQVIANQALSNPDVDMVKYAVVTGTPGVGKSVFVYYAMWRLIKEKKRVLLFDNNGLFYFDGSTMLNCLALPSKFNEEFWSPDLWCLVDSTDPTSIPGLPYRLCSVLLASTPRRDCISEFKKQPPTPNVFYMPLWSKEELAEIAHLYPHAAAVWVNRFDCLGGVPRLVLQDIETHPQTLLMSACNSCSLDDCIMLVSIYSEINSNTKIAQKLIHIKSQAPYKEYEVVYASELALQVIARTKWKSDRATMQNLLGSCDGNPLAQSLCGYVFETYGMDLLEKGGTFVCRKLLSDADMRKRDTMKRNRSKRNRGSPDNEDEETIDIPPSSQPRIIAKRVEVGQDANQLYMPQASNYTAIDAWMPQFGGFQMTVGKTHAIKGGAADDLVKLGLNGNRLFFLLPPLYYKSFTKKTPQTIEQFAILVPYPEQVK